MASLVGHSKARTRGSAPIESDRLALVELDLDDAVEMAGVLADDALYAFTGGRPPTVATLRKTYARLSRGHSADGRQEWRNWIVRIRTDKRAIGTVQATIVDAGRTASIAWIIGTAWQGQGFATEAAQAVVRWLDAHGVSTIRASIHPDHAASAAVAARAGLHPTDEIIDGERVWSRS